MSNSNGVVIEKRHFDPWGSLTKLEQNGVAVVAPFTSVTLFTDRGYTGHEHLLKMGLFNMNAILYDPKLHRFLQADSEPQNAADAQNYNRYNYCNSNPLKFTDPSGNDPILIGIVVGIAMYFADAIINRKPVDLGSIMKTITISGFSAVASFGIGEITSTIGNFFVRATVQAVAHGGFNGGMYAMQGGNFWNGFAAGSISSLAASAWSGGTTTTHYCDGVDGTVSHQGISGFLGANNGVGMIAFGTIAGGAGAALTGGNFWQGAVTGLIVSGLNHGLHMIEERKNIIDMLDCAEIDYKDAASYDNLSLRDFALKVLPELFSKANSPLLRKVEHLTDSNGNVIHGEGGCYSSTNYDSCEVTTSHIEITRSAFSSFYRLASVLGHELNHAIDNFNGTAQAWLLQGGQKYRESMSENNAYNWQFSTFSPLGNSLLNPDEFTFMRKFHQMRSSNF